MLAVHGKLWGSKISALILRKPFGQVVPSIPVVLLRLLMCLTDLLILRICASPLLLIAICDCLYGGLMKETILVEMIERKIYLIRGHKVMLDTDLAGLYEAATSNLNKAVKRNIDRFPPDFMFQLTKEEMDSLRFQFGILKPGEQAGTQTDITKPGRGQHRKYLPYVFTEQGVAMLSSVLNSKRAVQVNIAIMRVFVKLREMIASNKDLSRRLDDLEKNYDAQFKVVFRC